MESSNQDEASRVRLHRAAHKYLMRLNKAKVYIDDKKVAKLRLDETVVMDLAPGKHTIYAKMSGNFSDMLGLFVIKSEEMEFVVVSGQCVGIEFEVFEAQNKSKKVLGIFRAAPTLCKFFFFFYLFFQNQFNM